MFKALRALMVLPPLRSLTSLIAMKKFNALPFLKLGLSPAYDMEKTVRSFRRVVTVRYAWTDEEHFALLYGRVKDLPGVFSVNLATLLGYRLWKGRGAFMACFFTLLPALLMGIVAAVVMRLLGDLPWMEAVWAGVQPAAVALLTIPVVNMAARARINLSNCWIPIGATLLICLAGIFPVVVIVAAAVGGYLYGLWVKSTN